MHSGPVVEPEKLDFWCSACGGASSWGSSAPAAEAADASLLFCVLLMLFKVSTMNASRTYPVRNAVDRKPGSAASVGAGCLRSDFTGKRDLQFIRS